MAEKNKPIKRFTAGNVEVAVWENKHEDRTFYTAKISRFFKKEGEDQWQSTDFLNGSDLADAALLLQQIHRELVIKDRS